MIMTYGLMRKTPDVRDYTFAPPTKWDGSTFIDLAPHFPQKPYDQGQLGSCVSNGTGACVDFARAKAGQAPLGPPSRLFIYYNGRVDNGYPVGQDTGLQIRDGFAVIAKEGVPAESDWPYDISKFAVKPPAQAYADATHDVAVAYGSITAAQIADAVASGYPVAFGFDVYESFESDQAIRTGVVPIPNKATERSLGGHCMVVVSTPKDGSLIPHGVPGVKYVKVRNSWGHDGTYGMPEDPGYIWFPVQILTDGDSSDFWVVTHMDDPNVPVPPQPQPVPVSDDAELAAALHEWMSHKPKGAANTALKVVAKAWLANKGL